MHLTNTRARQETENDVKVFDPGRGKKPNPLTIPYRIEMRKPFMQEQLPGRLAKATARCLTPRETKKPEPPSPCIILRSHRKLYLK